MVTSIGMILFMTGIFFSKFFKFDSLMLFIILWGIVLSFSGMGLFQMLPFNHDIYLILGLGICMYIFAYLVSRYIFRVRFLIRPSKNERHIFAINYKLLLLFECILTIFVLVTAIRTLELLKNGTPMGSIHAMYLSRGTGQFFPSSFMRELHSEFIVPFFYTVCPLTVYLMLFDREQYRSFVYLNVALILLWVVATGGRFIVVYLLLDVLLALPLTKFSIPKETLKKIRRSAFVVIGFLLVAFLGYTVFRKGFGGDGTASSQVFEEIYQYLALCVPLSAHWMDYINTTGMHTNGMMVGNGILGNINWLLVHTGVGSIPQLAPANELMTSLEQMVPIFADANCNAFVTAFFYFYVDFRMIGVVLLSAIFGFVSGRVDKSVFSVQTPARIMTYLLFSQAIIKSFVRFEFGNTAYILSFLYLALILSRRIVASGTESENEVISYGKE